MGTVIVIAALMGTTLTHVPAFSAVPLSDQWLGRVR